MPELRGRDTTGRWLDPESDGPAGSGAAKRSAPAGHNEEFGGRVIRPPKDAKAGSAVADVDFAEAVSDGKADVQRVVKESRINEVLEEINNKLIGLQGVKRRLREISALLVIDRLRNEMGLMSERP